MRNICTTSPITLLSLSLSFLGKPAHEKSVLQFSCISVDEGSVDTGPTRLLLKYKFVDTRSTATTENDVLRIPAFSTARVSKLCVVVGWCRLIPVSHESFIHIKFNSETIAAGYQGPTTGSFIISCASLISPTGTRIYLSNLHDFSRTSALTLPTNGASLSAAKPIKGFSWETLQDQMSLQVSLLAYRVFSRSVPSKCFFKKSN